MRERYAFVIVIKGKWWNEFRRLNRSGKTNHAYVQKGFGPPKNARLIFFYVVKPVGEIQGYAKFQKRIVGDSETMWRTYGNQSCLQSEEQYYDLLEGRSQASFIMFTDLHEAAKPIPLNSIWESLGVKRFSRMGLYIGKEAADKLIEIME